MEKVKCFEVSIKQDANPKRSRCPHNYEKLNWKLASTINVLQPFPAAIFSTIGDSFLSLSFTMKVSYLRIPRIESNG